MSRRDRIVLEEQAAGGRWVAVATAHEGRDGRGAVTAPRVSQGAHRYRLGVIRGGHTVAISAQLTIYAYADVPLGRIVGRAAHTFDVNGRLFTYVVGLFQRDGDGVAMAPQVSQLASAATSTCRSIRLTVAAVSPLFGASGGDLRISVSQGSATASAADLAANQIAPVSGRLDGGLEWRVYASIRSLARIQNGQQRLDVAANGSLSCYSASGH